MDENLTDQEFQDALFNAISEDPEILGVDAPEVAVVTSFEDEGLLTMDKGVVVELVNGQTFYLTIQQR